MTCTFNLYIKSADLFLFVVLAFRNALQYRHSGVKRFIYDDLDTLFKNLVKFSRITPEFKIGKHPSFLFLKFNFLDKLYQDLPDRFSTYFHNPFSSDCSWDVTMATIFGLKMGEISQLTFIRRLGIPKRSRI